MDNANKKVKVLAGLMKSSREAVGLLQETVAKMFGYGSSQFISNWERGKSNAPIPVMKALEGVYKLKKKTLTNAYLDMIEARVDAVEPAEILKVGQ